MVFNEILFKYKFIVLIVFYTINLNLLMKFASWLILLEYNPLAQYLSQEPGLLRGHTASATMKIDRYHDRDCLFYFLFFIFYFLKKWFLRNNPELGYDNYDCLRLFPSLIMTQESTIYLKLDCMTLFKVWFKTTGLCLNNLGVTCSSS